MAYMIYFEFLTHATIAINRWSVLRHVATHAGSAEERTPTKGTLGPKYRAININLTQGMLVLFLLPLPGAALRLFVRMTSASSTTNGGGTSPHALPWMFAVRYI